MESRSPGDSARLILIGLLVFLALSGTAPSVMPPPTARAAGPAGDAAFGPQLFLLGPSPLQAEIPPDVPATIHAALYGEEPARYIASAGPDLPDWAAAKDLPARLLDADTAGKVYYFADALADGASEAASQFGTIIYADERQLLVAVPGENEPGLLAALPGQGIGLSLLSPDAIVAVANSTSRTLLPLITTQKTPSQISASPVPDAAAAAHRTADRQPDGRVIHCGAAAAGHRPGDQRPNRRAERRSRCRHRRRYGHARHAIHLRRRCSRR